MSDQNPIDQLFKERLEKHQLKPSEAVWQKVQAASPAQKAPKNTLYVLRAATVALLIGLNSVFYFTNNEVSLSTVEPLPATTNVAAQNKEDEVNAAPLATEPKKEPNTKKGKPTEKDPAPKGQSKPSKVIPALSQPTRATQIFVANELPLADEAELQTHAEPTALSTVELNAYKVQPYSVTIRDLPETHGDYSQEKNQAKNTKFSDKLWAYASDQVNRILIGEKPQLPKTTKTPQLAITLPKFFTPLNQPK